MTNFEYITKSPENLAKFIDDITYYCANGGSSSCKLCPMTGYGCCKQTDILKYLNAEYNK